MSVSSMLEDMKHSYNVNVKTSRHFIYFNSISVDFLIGNDNTLFIDHIISQSAFKGFASRTIDEICHYADKHNVILWLEVAPFPLYDGAEIKLNKNQLIEWYNRHGFECEIFCNQNGGNRVDLGCFQTMIRKPRNSTY
jgi:hypothetical protein